MTARPEAHILGADPGEASLRDWNQGNLQSYWRPLAATVRAALGGLDRGEVLPDEVVPWGRSALGSNRLPATIMTGEIISKTAAADNTVKLLPEHGGLLARAKAHRLSDDRECFAIAEGDGDCDRVDAVVNDEASIASR